jgi:hypothetical protein
MMRAFNVIRILTEAPSQNVAPLMGILVGAMAIVSGVTMQLAAHLLLLSQTAMRVWTQGRMTMIMIC